MRSYGSHGVKTRRSAGLLLLLLRPLFASSSLLTLLAASGVEATAIRIMPLGDSITVGVGDDNNGGYRGPLYQMLTSTTSVVDFVGSQIGGTITDRNHEGHSGWRADQIRDSVPGWLTAARPDIVLLHIGTNDITQGQQVPGTVTEIGEILDIVDSYETSHGTPITVVLARIINRSNSLDALGLETTAFNASIASMAAARIAAGDRLVVVDHESALSYPGDLVDSVHPNASGYQKMAAVWYEGLHPLLRNRGEFVSDTIPRAMIPGATYECSVTMHNSGLEAWLCWPAGTMLTIGQTAGPIANKLIPYPYYEIYTTPCQIDVGQECTFPFTVGVPADTPFGDYEISWQMKDSSEWFDSSAHSAVFRKTVAVRPYPFYAGDFDDDGDVDQEDFGHFQACLSGARDPQNDPSCADARLDGDSDVDQQDLAVFRRCSSGAAYRPDSSCVQ
ncbi:MAG TPA: GDSL-type esterase/lipase family protein [Phycisphaerae bacterium]|nr:GDSL-type esterase/lipase family protein [Phycisphaerae bacterium]HRY68464.1 GDSL-type esterase/lipase family protein [Phycisphaerae bacterium]HSA28500.1 GDSL-type esterase/lipase family protein [Phycisphaerae bacterium]